MKNLLDIIPSNLSSALGWTLVHSVWQGVVILLVFSVLFQFYKQNSAMKYWLGIGGLGSQVLASVITFSWIFEPNFTNNFTEKITTNLSVLNGSSLSQIVQNREISWFENTQIFLNSHVDLLVNIWFLGIIFLTLKLMGGFIYVQNLKSKRTYFLDDATEKIFKNLLKKSQISQHVYLFESALAKTPMTIGYFEVVILLPMGLATGLPVKELEAVLAHELAHIRRADYLVNILQTLVEIVFFFHPAIWYISTKIREERENCCDDLAMEMVGDKIHLAKALTNIELFRQRESLAMAFGGNKQNLLSRVQRILGVNHSKTSNYEGFFAVVLVMLASIFYVNIEKANAQEPIPSKRPVAPIAPKPPKSIKQTFIQGNDGTVHNYINNHEMHIQDGYIVVDGEIVKLSPEDSTKLRYHQQEMKKLQEKMQPYQDKMTKLGAEMQTYSTKIQAQTQPLSAHGKELGVLGEKLGKLSRKQAIAELQLEDLKEGSKEKMLLEKQLAELKAQNIALEKQMNLHEKLMEEVELKMENVEAPMEKLGKEMEEQGKYMEEIGKEMEVHGEAIEKLIPEEVRKKFSMGRPPKPPRPPKAPKAPVPPVPPRGNF
jgi:bla regulator protein blaR1